MQRLKWTLLIVFVALTGWALGQPIQSVTSEPLLQATATPRTMSLGGVTLPCYDAGLILSQVSTCLMGTHDPTVASGSSFPYGAGTPIPVSGAGGYAVGTVVPVQPNGAPAAQTPQAVAMAGQMVAVRSTVIIPAGTPTPYTAGDVITSATPAALSFAGACRSNGGSGYIVAADLATDQAAFVGATRAWVYQSAPPTPILDNAANALLFVNNAIRVGYVDLPNAFTNTGSNTAAYAQNNDIRVAYQCAAGATNLVVVLEASSAFTPASGQTFDLGLRLAPN